MTLGDETPSPDHQASGTYYTNTKYEQISCHPLKPTYGGSPDHLIFILAKLDIHQQSEGRAPVTYITIDSVTYNMSQFASVQE